MAHEEQELLSPTPMPQIDVIDERLVGILKALTHTKRAVDLGLNHLNPGEISVDDQARLDRIHASLRNIIRISSVIEVDVTEVFDDEESEALIETEAELVEDVIEDQVEVDDEDDVELEVVEEAQVEEVEPTVLAEEPVENIDEVIAEEVVEPEPIEVTEEMLELANQVISKLTATAKKAFIPYALIMETASNGTKLSLLEKKQLAAALSQDDRIEHFRDGIYMIVDRSDEVMQAYMNGKNPLVDVDYLTELAEQMLVNSEGTWKRRRGILGHGNVMGTIKHMGEFLSIEEQNELFVILSNMPDITLLPNGDLRITTEEPFEEQPKQRKRTTKSVDENGFVDFDAQAEDGESLSSSQVRDALKEMKRTPEYRYSVDRAKRKADTRKRGKNFRKKGARMMGKAHGHKKSLDELIADMNTKRAT